ncbi:MAG: NAD(P)-dependent oxidoreductase [Opitutaceae bacterium]|jgi:glutamate synthase (NADPH/NADH) small chain
MGADPISIWNSKYAWSLIAREAPPKRAPSERINDTREIYLTYDEEAVRAQASRCIQCPYPGCVQACPLGNRIPEWLALAAAGDFLGAAEISRSTSNLPEICSRICPQERLCESGCILCGPSEPVAIGAIERFINDYALNHGAVPAVPGYPNGLKAAVVGSGPGGLACADQLAGQGFAVTVFDSQARPGGLLASGIPEFKLDRALVERRIEMLKGRGVEFRLGVRVGQDLSLRELQEQFDAVFLAFGAQRAKPLNIPGADLDGVIQALPFLIGADMGPPARELPVPVKDKRVVVLGGGDTAMDCLRLAIRGGARDALCLYRRDLANMPGSMAEYANALDEGARFEFLTNPVALEGTPAGAVARVRCERMELGEPDAKGRRRPSPVADSEFSVPADLVLVAYGFDPAPFPAGSDFCRLALNEWGGIIVDSDQMTSVPGVFAGGDSTRGPSLVVHAVRDGRRAAAAIGRYLESVRA